MIDEKLFEKYLNMDIKDPFALKDDFSLFLDMCFGTKRIIVIRCKNRKRYVKKSLKDYCINNQIDFKTLNAQVITTTDIKGNYEIIQVHGKPESQRILPEYIKELKQIIIVENLDNNADIEVLRAFTYMACLGSYWNNIENLPKDKLPYGSSYVFIVDENFPYAKFDMITSHWREELFVYDAREFTVRVKEKLETYKRNVIGISANGIFNYKGEEYNYGYILPKKEKWKNILPYKNCKVKDKFISENQLHKYFHHLNSSQAMCLNFFYPLICEKKLDVILNTLFIYGDVDYKAVEFEKVSSLDIGYGRSTNFDFYIPLIDGRKIYFEIKYTESGFGKAKNDMEHKKKYENLYKPLLTNNMAINNKFKKQEIFLENYQIIRNLVHINDKSTVVFIYPKNNIRIREDINKVKNEILDDNWHKHFIPITWEQITNTVLSFVSEPELVEYYQKKFIAKYLNL